MGRGRDWPASGFAPVYSYSKYFCIQDREALVAHFNGVFENTQHFLIINFEISIVQSWGLLPHSTSDPLISNGL